MSVRLGIDTGGTYTDAVVMDEQRGVLASGKVLTRHDDLGRSVGEALAEVLRDPRPLDLVAVSTTLATNAIVEGQGGEACLILIGQGPEVLARAALQRSLGASPVVYVDGGHRASGEEQSPLDEQAVREAVRKQAPAVQAFAVAGLFAVRNPAHELRAREIIAELSAVPVTCGHELSVQLDAPRRALPALINARLVPLISELIDAVEANLRERAIEAPLMVVKGDGSMVAAAVARQRPIETILSGPAASTVGARHLSGCDDAVVVDIGGTTTDIGILRDGWPALTESGARVARLPTMVAAIRAHTYGLGGDSEVHCAGPSLSLGPQRAVPLSLLAHERPEVLEALRSQRERGFAHEYDARFAVRRRPLGAAKLTHSERAIWELLAPGPATLEQLHQRVASELPLQRLRSRGLVAVAALTPSDAAHVLGFHRDWSREAAELGLELTLRRAAVRGAPPCPAADFAARIVEALASQSTEIIVDAVLREEGEEPPGAPDPLLARANGARPGSLLGVSLRLQSTLIAIGASAAHYYPAIAERLGVQLSTPPHLAVANAVGAAMSAIVQRASALITLPRDDLYRVHTGGGTADFPSLEQAVEHAGSAAREQAVQAARDAGARRSHCETLRHDNVVTGPDGHRTFLESRVTVVARGDPV